MSHFPDSLKFCRRSFVYIFNTILIALGMLDTILTIRLVMKKKISLSSITAFAFFLVTVIASLLLRDLAKKWPKLMMYWHKKEEIFLGYPYKAPKTNPTVVITTIAYSIFSMVLCEFLSGFCRKIC